MSDPEIVLDPPDVETARRNARIIRRRRMERSPQLRVRHQVMCTEPPKSALKKAFQIYDPGFPEPSTLRELLDQLVEIFCSSAH